MEIWNKYIKKYAFLFCLCISFLIVEALCDLMQPTIMSKIIDSGVANKNLDLVTKKGIKMLLVAGLGAICAIMRNIISSNVSLRFAADLRSDLYRKVNSFSFENKDKFETASLITRLTNDVTQIQNFVHGLMRILIKAPVTGIGCIIMVALLNKRLVAVLIIIIPIIFILIGLSMKIGYPYFSKLQKALDKVNSIIREYLAGVRVVKAFNNYYYEIGKFRKANKKLSEIGMTSARAMIIFSPAITLIVNIGIVSVLWFGGIYVNTGKMQVGEIIAFTNYMTQLLFSLMMVFNVFNVFIRAKASAERVKEVLTQENNIVESKKEVITNIEGKVEFKNVDFGYIEGINVLNNISFKCNKGQLIGIIGSTGSGKTTLVNLIPRFYDINHGEIKIDGVNVKDYLKKTLNSKIAIVPQKNVLFSGTIAENIRWGKENATQDEVIMAAKIAQAHNFITSFEKGYDTVLGQGGINLSGGQKQRIAIARALLKDAEIIILDDSTSAVDVQTEAKIREALKQYSKDITFIMIAQRISSVMNADNIIVLENGKIEAQGVHNELLKSCEIYKAIYRSQFGDD